MLTTEDMARLRVPLTALPGLDPVGLRLATWTAYHRADPKPSGYETFLGTSGSDFVVWGRRESAPRVRHRVALDLADAATRDRVARWLAGRVGLEVGSTAPPWVRVWGRSWEMRPCRRFDVDGEEMRNDWLWGHERPLGGQRWTEVPALADLDPTDARRLPDGSRYVDALALALVAVGAP